MVGLIDAEEHITTQWFQKPGDAIILLGGTCSVASHQSDDTEVPPFGLGGSRFLKVCHGLKEGPVPRLNLELEIKVQNAVRDLIRQGLVRSAHDCSEGGLAVALAECCFNPGGLIGAKVNCSHSPAGPRPATTEILFNESHSRIVISVSPADADKVTRILGEQGVPHQQIGKTGADQLSIRIDEESFQWPVAEVYDLWWNAIRRAVESDGSGESIPSL
jgi:phosphoribosylformylglycinamidine synthase